MKFSLETIFSSQQQQQEREEKRKEERVVNESNTSGERDKRKKREGENQDKKCQEEKRTATYDFHQQIVVKKLEEENKDRPKVWRERKRGNSYLPFSPSSSFFLSLSLRILEEHQSLSKLNFFTSLHPSLKWEKKWGRIREKRAPKDREWRIGIRILFR